MLTTRLNRYDQNGNDDNSIGEELIRDINTNEIINPLLTTFQPNLMGPLAPTKVTTLYWMNHSGASQ